MAERRSRLGWIGRILGLALVVAAVVSVFFIDWKTEPPEEPPLIRPLKTIVVESPFASLERELPGKVKANRRVDLSFEVSGLVIEILVKKSEMVKEGQLLVRIDPRDYQNDLDSAEAELDRAEAHRDRIQVAVDKNAVAKQSLTDAIAAFEVAQAKVRIRQKALEDTYLRAKFPGIIANRFIENFENVQAKQPILSLQDISSVEVEVNIPEAFVALAKKRDIATAKEEDIKKFVVTFDYLPGREFEVTGKEFATEADSKTQTYAATFIMPSPEDVNILPGMTATIHALLRVSEEDVPAGYALPVGVVPVDGRGNYYVWKVEKDAGEIYTVRRADVNVGELMEGVIQVLDGVAPGDRIAAAGVHFLQEGQRVRLLTPAPENEEL
jgi:multidrug efflux system membrane fusion protein